MRRRGSHVYNSPTKGRETCRETWHCHGYSATGAYVGKGATAQKNRHRERLWFSPHCLPIDLRHAATIAGPLFAEPGP
jgi:hypothetical protein